MPCVLIACQQATCRNVTGYTAASELPLSIRSVVEIFTLRTYEKVICWALERQGLVNTMLIVVSSGEFRAIPFVVRGKARDGSAGEFPAPVRVRIVVHVFYLPNRVATGAVYVEVTLIFVIPVCQCANCKRIIATL